MRPGIREFGRISQSIREISYGTRYVEHKWRPMLSLCGDAGALGTARDARGDRSAELVRGHVLAALAAFENAAEMRQATMVGTGDRTGLFSRVTGGESTWRTSVAGMTDRQAVGAIIGAADGRRGARDHGRRS